MLTIYLAVQFAQLLYILSANSWFSNLDSSVLYFTLDVSLLPWMISHCPPLSLQIFQIFKVNIKYGLFHEGFPPPQTKMYTHAFAGEFFIS